MNVCSGEADSQWRALSVVCPTGDIMCAEDLCDGILGIVLRCVVITVMTSSGVCVWVCFCGQDNWAYKGRMSLVIGELC